MFISLPTANVFLSFSCSIRVERSCSCMLLLFLHIDSVGGVGYFDKFAQ
jgi:hypothetical protein